MTMLGIITGVVGRLATQAVKTGFDIWQKREDDRREERAWQRQKEDRQWEAENQERIQSGLTERAEISELGKTTRANIADQRDLKGAAQWVINLSKSLRPILTYIGFVWFLVLLTYMMLMGWLNIPAVAQAAMLGFIELVFMMATFWFTGRPFERRER